jgi:hypothetical protein
MLDLDIFIIKKLTKNIIQIKILKIINVSLNQKVFYIKFKLDFLIDY